MDTWTTISADRRLFADYLAALTPTEWDSSTWCGGWDVRAVTAHLLVAPTLSKGQIFRNFATSGFNLDKMSARLVGRMTAAMSNQQLESTTRDTADVHSAPPGLKPVGVLTELLVHAADISLAIDRPFSVPAAHYVTVLDHLKTVQPVLGCRKRIAGLRLVTTDAEWSTGDGPTVKGDAPHMLAAMTGRRQACDALTGDGVDLLRSR